MFYVYLLQNESDDIYVGSTNDLRRRFLQHNRGHSKSTRGHQWKLVYYEAFVNESDAREREQKLKQHGYSIRHLKNRLQRCLNKI